MSGIRISTLAMVVACLVVGSCSKPSTPKANSEKKGVVGNHRTPTKLVFTQQLLVSELKLLTAFADINGDGKPDMIMGSNGHVFSDSAPRVRKSNTVGEYRHYVSHLLNTSNHKQVDFGKPYWPNVHGENGQLPSG